jgi:hypothetical protein
MPSTLIRWRFALINHLWFQLKIAYTKPEYGGNDYLYKIRHHIKNRIDELECPFWYYAVAYKILVEEYL